MELKLAKFAEATEKAKRFNRTFMELKLELSSFEQMKS